MLSVSYLLHQLPEDVWWRTSWDEILDILEIHQRANGKTREPDAVEPLHDFDKEQIAAFKANIARGK